MRIFTAGFALGLAALAAPAVAALDGDFELVNRSTYELHAFNTHEHGEWSDNWLDQRVDPGDTFEMTWGEEGNCSVRARVTYSNGDYVEAPIDFCEASRIVVTNDGMSWQ